MMQRDLRETFKQLQEEQRSLSNETKIINEPIPLSLHDKLYNNHHVKRSPNTSPPIIIDENKNNNNNNLNIKYNKNKTIRQPRKNWRKILFEPQNEYSDNYYTTTTTTTSTSTGEPFF